MKKNIYDIGNFVNVKTEQVIITNLVNNFVKRRKECRLTQKELSRLTGVSYASIRRFETTGEISLRALIKLASGVGLLTDFEQLFSVPIPKPIKG